MVRQYSELRRFLRSRWGIGTLALLVAMTVLVILDHWTPADERTVLLSGLVIACVVMHLFLHGGRGGNQGPDKGAK